jgi:excisionase family DNA binding protein
MAAHVIAPAGPAGLSPAGLATAGPVGDVGGGVDVQRRRREALWAAFLDAVKAAGMFRFAYPTAEVARLLGISRSYAHELIAKGVIPSVRIGGKRVVPAPDLLALLDAPSDVAGGRGAA